jgi:hypothetical protein
MRKSLCVLATLVACSTLAHSARAQDDDSGAADAKKQYQAGTQAYQARRFNEAALAFEAAAAYKANAVVLYAAAQAWEQSNAPERAADAYSRALDVSGLTPQQTVTAKERVASLEKTLGTLVVTGPEGFKVQLDSLTTTTVPARLHAAPGTHVLVVRASKGEMQKRDVTLDLGLAESLDVTPKVEAPKVEAPKVEAPKPVTIEVEGPPRVSVKKAIGFTAIGLGVMGLASGVVLGLNANDAGDAYNAGPTRRAFDHANALATWTTIAFISGGVFVAGGIVLVLLPESKSSTASDAAPEVKPDAPSGKPDDHETPPKEPSLSLSLVPTLGGAMFRGSF